MTAAASPCTQRQHAVRLTAFSAATTFALLAGATLATAQTPAQSHDEVVAAARREGKVVVIAPPDPNMRKAIPAAFKSRYGVTVEYMGGRSNEQAAQLRAERKAGIYTVDIALAGIQTMATVFHRERMLAPLKPHLFFPDVIDPAKWKRGHLWFSDPEQQFVLRLLSSVGPSFYINTSIVKPSEFRSAKDLLDPKWRGRITAHDPTVPGNGSNESARLYVSLGQEFLQRLYFEQKTVIYRDRRQITDALARGKSPIAFGPEREEIERLRQEGFPVEPVYGLPDLPGSLTTGIGLLALMDRAPHPNAAKLFANWIASQEGMKIFSRERGEVPTRNDIGEEAFVTTNAIPKPGVDYFDIADWDFTVSKKEQIRLWVKAQFEAR